MKVTSKNALLSQGASHVIFLMIRMQMNAENKGIISTLSANQSVADEEIVAINFFLLCR